MSIDRLPPQSIEAEQSVLGALLIDRDAVIEVADFLRPADFYRQAHGTIYEAILELYERREPVDIVTVSEVLTRHEALDQVGGSAYLTITDQPDAHGGQRRPLRPHRRAQGHPAQPDRRGRPDRRHRLRGHGGGQHLHRQGGAGTLRRQPEARRGRLHTTQAAAPLGLRPAGLPAPAQGRDQRRPDGLPGPGHADQRAAEEST